MDHLRNLGDIDMVNLDKAYKELVKAQERFAMLAVLASYKAKLLAKSAGLTVWLDQQKEDMEKFAHTGLPEELATGFEGKAAESAKTYLADISKPDLESPIKKG